MARTALADRVLPEYTIGEEIMNMVTHIVGSVIGVAVLVLCVVRSALNGSVAGVVTSVFYGITMIALYTMSSIYHGLRHPTAKKVFQVLDHCTIYFLIAGTYTPISICGFSKVNSAAGWTLFAVVWSLTAIAVTLTAIDLKQYKAFSMVCYIGIGWSILPVIRQTIEAVSVPGFAWLMAGGVFYTVGAVLYGVGKKKKYIHSVFHIFVLLGSITHAVCILLYVL